MRKRWIFRVKPIVALLLSVAMIIPVTGCKKEDTSPDEPSMKIMDANDAIAQLASAEADYGYENALSELTEKVSSTIDGDSYYRLQQNYKGIPVYGRTVVCATDDNGNVTSVTGNPVDIELAISTTPTITLVQVQDSIFSYINDILGYSFTESVNIDMLSDNDLCFYSASESGEVYLSYCVPFGGYDFIIDATTGEVLLSVATIQDLTVSGYKASDSRMENPFNVEKYGETEYALEDKECNIVVKDLKGIPSTEKDDTIWNLNKADRVVSTDNIFGNDPVTESAHEDGVTLLQTFKKMYEFFSVKLKVAKQSGTGAFVLYYRDGYQDGTNARGGRDGENNGILMMGSKFGMTDLDVVAHEYTHIITRTNVNWTNATIENYALDEAYSDIFGELVESWYNNKTQPNWIIDVDFNSRTLRNIQTPSATDNAVSAEGIPDNFGFTKDEIRSYGYKYSTVISHAAYLMWNGIDGTEAKKISTDDLAKLWYRTMLMMPSDCNFSGCRKLAELAATSMELTTTQIECVSEAFDTVGITGATKGSFDALYDLVPNSTLSVYGGDSGRGGELYNNYTLQITGNTAIYGPVIEKVDSSYNRTIRISDAEPYALNLPEGIYTFTITDNANPSYTRTFTVCIQNNDGDANLDIFTNFGCIHVKGTVSEIKEVNGVETNVPITNAVVKVYSYAKESVVETIYMSEPKKTKGVFEVELPVGNYSFDVEAERYISSKTPVYMTANEAVYLDIVLEADTERLLTQVNCYHSNGIRNQYNLTYNENNLLERYSTDIYSSFGNDHYEYDMVYNENGKLTCYQNVEKTYPEQEYYYSGNGNLIGWSYWENEGMQVEYACEYDEQGRLVREYTADENETTDYTYNAAGQLISTSNHTMYGDMKSSTVCTYAYDSNDRLAEKVITSDWGFGPSTETLRYCYEYYPFILTESCYNGITEPTSLQLQGLETDQLVSFWVDGSASFEMKDGYLTTVSGDGYSYEFFYNGQTSGSFADSLPAVKYEYEITGTYIADYEDVTITITAENDSEYFLTYTTSGATLENIPLTYFNNANPTEKLLMFDLNAYYPEHSGYVEFCWTENSISPYSYNAQIDGVEDTEGYYSTLKKIGVFVPTN